MNQILITRRLTRELHLLIPRTMLACEASATVIKQARDADPILLWAFRRAARPGGDLSRLCGPLHVYVCVLGRGGFVRRMYKNRSGLQQVWHDTFAEI
jgi:hypothetical protein